jgi:hypothetical protein
MAQLHCGGQADEPGEGKRDQDVAGDELEDAHRVVARLRAYMYARALWDNVANVS